MSDMDSDETWAQPSNQAEDYDCGPDSGLLLPSVYRVDPGQVDTVGGIICTFGGRKPHHRLVPCNFL